MIVARVSRGSSFKGVTAYLAHTHDNDNRATFTATQNMATDNVYMAARFMAATAMDAEAIKLANGWNGKGRKSTDKPVYHAFMSWDESRHPDIEHQEQSARELLKAMGLEKAQAIIVGHDSTDNEKTHLHIVVNLIDPETGKQFSLSNDERKMQAWALDYCKANGIDIDQIAPNRAKNAEKRKSLEGTRESEGENGKTQDLGLEGNKRLSRAEWLKMKEELFKRQSDERGILRGLHGKDWENAKAEISARKREAKQAFSAEYQKQKAEAKERNRPQWREFFKQQKTERAKLEIEMREAVKQYRRSRSFAGRVLSGLGLGQRADQAEAKLATVQMNLATLQGQQEQQRADFAKQLSQETFERTVQAVPPLERLDLGGMKERHDRERERLREKQQAERENAGIKTNDRAKTSEQGNEQDKTPKTAKERWEAKKARDLSDRAKAELEKMRQRDRQNRERGRDRGREM